MVREHRLRNFAGHIVPLKISGLFVFPDSSRAEKFKSVEVLVSILRMNGNWRSN
jgi:hypothetical protein